MSAGAFGRRGIFSFALQQICAIQRRRPHAHTHGGRGRAFDFRDLQNFNAAFAIDADGSHSFV